MPSLSLVIPAFNEERRIDALLDAVSDGAARDLAQGGLELTEVVVVDDGSTDATPARLAAAPPAVRVVTGPHRGKGAAVAAGVREAAGELVLIADVDLATPLAEAGKLHDALRGGAAVAVGSRSVAGAEVVGLTPRRMLAGRAFNSLARLTCGLAVRDTQCGFKLLPADVARTLLAEQLVEGFAYDVELLLRARTAGLRVAEVPVLWVHSRPSKLSMSRASPEMVRDLARLAWNFRLKPGRRARPGVESPSMSPRSDDPLSPNHAEHPETKVPAHAARGGRRSRSGS